MSVASYFKNVTVEAVKAAYAANGYTLSTNGDYNLNIFGIRTNDPVSNAFNDVVGVLFKIDGEWVLKKYDATTDPGIYWRNNLMNVKGTAILQPGFYKGAFRIGMHQGKYEALVQNVPFKFWRDKNKDDTLDMEGETYTEVAGVNLHHAGAASTQVDKWSAGCQVIANLDNFNELMSIVHKSQAGNTFSYALFTEQQFFDK